MTNPKPCPVCGRKHSEVNSWEEELFWGECPRDDGGCGLIGPEQPSKEEAVSFWNRLVLQPEAVSKSQERRFRAQRGLRVQLDYCDVCLASLPEGADECPGCKAEVV